MSDNEPELATSRVAQTWRKIAGHLPRLAGTLLPPAAIQELRAKVEGYVLLRCQTAAQDPCTRDIVNVLKQKANADLWWTDLVQIELCTIDLLSPEDVESHLGRWRQRFREVLGETRYSNYVSSAPDLRTSDAATLKADLKVCVKAVYFFYATYGVAATSRSNVTKALLSVGAAMVAVIVFAIVALGSNRVSHLSHELVLTLTWILTTAIFGVVGSIVSVERRLQDPTVTVDPYYRYVTTTEDSIGTALFSPIMGFVSALLVYGFFLSGLAQGTALPAFTSLKDATGNVVGLVPAAPKDMALLLVFGFIAGFAEQLVPDALNRLATKALGSVASLTPSPGVNGTLPAKVVGQTAGAVAVNATNHPVTTAQAGARGNG